MPHAANDVSVAVRDAVSKASLVSSRIRDRAAAPVIPNTTPTVLGHIFDNFVAAISVSIEMSGRARDLVAQIGFHIRVPGQLMKQNGAFEIKTNHKRLLTVDDLFARCIPPPRSVRFLQTAKELNR